MAFVEDLIDKPTRKVGQVFLRNPGDTVSLGDAANPLRVDPTGATSQPITAVSLPLPTGAATETTLATLLLDATFTARVNTLGQKVMAASTPVVLASDQSSIPVAATQSGTWDVNNISGTISLPTGAATEATLATRLSDATFTGRINTQGQKTMALSTPVVLASDQSVIPVSQSGAWTVTANAGTNLNTSALALSATQTDGTQRTKITDGTNNAAVASATSVGTEQGLVTRPVEVFNSRSDTYAAAGNGTTVSVATNPVKFFSVQVKGTGAAATNWDVRLEGSLDNVTFSQILRHRQTDGDGTTLFTGGTGQFPCLYFRSRLVSITLGGATDIVVTILGMD